MSTTTQLFEKADKLFNEILNICDNSIHNEKVFVLLKNRMVHAKKVTGILQKRKPENEKKYDITLNCFVKVLERIKTFAFDISRLSGHNKYLTVNLIRDRYTKVINEFDSVMNELQLIPAFHEERGKNKQDTVCSVVSETMKFINIVEEDTDNTLFQDLVMIKKQLERVENDKVEHNEAYEINSNELTDSLVKKPTDKKGLVKKLYKSNEVACKTITADNNPSKIKIQLSLLRSFRDSPYIIKFFGLSQINNERVMVLEWAELGSLKDVYNKYDIPLDRKIQIALQICRGIVSLNFCGIFHRDIRCQSILLTFKQEPKISNFKHVQKHTDEENKVKHMNMNWMAPEILEKSSSYTPKCEVFSFGMLLWEFAFERIPYMCFRMEKMKAHVLSGKREQIWWGKNIQNIQSKKDYENIIKDYENIIVDAWQADPAIRPSLHDILMRLSCLAGSQDKLADIPKLLTKQGSGIISPIEKGIEEHNNKCAKDAYEFFVNLSLYSDTHTKYRAKYWQGYYLWEGSVESRNREKARELFKEAADGGITEAQLYYAFSLVNQRELKLEKNNRDEFLKYIKMAADNDSPIAQFYLGDLYLNGKLGEKKDIELGKQYLKLAAANVQNREAA
ncbi:16752_t:CDS:2 [Acaulospora morrowiae]|uniref:16752_t:CDS:1 n=1 Tax=Acaulospora morrowiae TaxID=94023 RepID=A0A9N9AC58_9GLOM|nr:16752_t:CDS:2 [Acaulospora morrowiae]